MKEQLISFETAKLAKEKGFDWKCRGKIHCSHFHLIKNNIIPSNIPTSQYEMFAPLRDWNHELYNDPNRRGGTLTGLELSMPTQSFLQKWLREKYNLIVNVACNAKQCYFPMNGFAEDGAFQMAGPKELIIFKTYEEALEHGLSEALKLIK